MYSALVQMGCVRHVSSPVHSHVSGDAEAAFDLHNEQIQRKAQLVWHHVANEEQEADQRIILQAQHQHNSIKE